MIKIYKIYIKKYIKNIINDNIINDKNNGFTLLEAVIAIFITLVIFGGLTTLSVSSVKNSKFEEHLIGLNSLVDQKTSGLFNNISSELTKFPVGATQVGSINIDTPLIGYFDLLNESGCIVSVVNTGNFGNTTLDCSGSIVDRPSMDRTPKFRRQWTIKNNFPKPGDVSIGVVVVYQQTNQIAKSNFITKSDNTNSK